MFRKFQPLAIAVVMTVSSTCAMAADNGFYGNFGAGIAFANDSGLKGHDSAIYSPPLDATAKSDAGFAASGAVGYGFANGLRVEGELGYRANDVEEINVKEPGSLAAILPPGAPPGVLRGKRAVVGDVAATTLIANLYYDFDTGTAWMPYVGGGVGLARLSVTSKSKTTGTTLVDDNDTVFAYKIGGGIGYEINESGGRPVIVSLDYRYYGTADPTFTGALTGTQFDTEQSGHYAGVGLRFGF